MTIEELTKVLEANTKAFQEVKSPDLSGLAKSADLAGLAKLMDVESIKAKLDELGKPMKVEAATDGKPAEAELHRSMVGGLTSMKVWNLPVGAIAFGTFGGVFVNELLDGFMAKQGVMVRGAVKLAVAGVVAGWGKKWLRDATYPIALVLGVFGLSQVIPIDKYATQLASSVRGFLPGTIKVTGMGNPGTESGANIYKGMGGRIG